MEKIYKYEELSYKKDQGKGLSWETITKEQLEALFKENIPDSMIADLYDVSRNIVSYRIVKERVRNSELYHKLNKSAKKNLLSIEKVNSLSKAITHYAFRNGPVEDMHTNGKLSQEDMNILNTFMVNRLASLLVYINNNNWAELEILFGFYSKYGIEWDIAVPDFTEFNCLWNGLFVRLAK